MKDAWLLLARLLLMSFFFVELMDKIRRFRHWSDIVRKVGMPLPEAEMALVITLLSIGCLSLLLGYRMQVGIVCLLVFLAPTALIFESAGGALRCASIAGGLIALGVVGPGRYSLQAVLESRAATLLTAGG